MNKILPIAILVMAALLGLQPAFATDAPSIVVGNLKEDPTSRLETLAKYDQVIEQYKAQLVYLKQQYTTLTGVRGLGLIAMSPAIRESLPVDWQAIYDAINNGGYGGLTGPAQAIRDANSLFNSCLSTSELSSSCDRDAADSMQVKAAGIKSFELARQRWNQIILQLAQVNQGTATEDINELQARINYETNAIRNEYTKLQMYAMVATAEDRLVQRQGRRRSSTHFNDLKNATPKRVK